MLERVDRVQLVVKDRQAAARTFGTRWLYSPGLTALE